VIYFMGAVVSHLRVRDFEGIGPAVFMLVFAAGALTRFAVHAVYQQKIESAKQRLGP
jgi:hypothetical protein